MSNSRIINSFRHNANRYEEVANNWLAFAKDKKHSKALRIRAAKHYRDNMRRAKECRERAEQLSMS